MGELIYQYNCLLPSGTKFKFKINTPDYKNDSIEMQFFVTMDFRKDKEKFIKNNFDIITGIFKYGLSNDSMCKIKKKMKARAIKYAQPFTMKDVRAANKIIDGLDINVNKFPKIKERGRRHGI